jgi:hypothetical protein
MEFGDTPMKMAMNMRWLEPETGVSIVDITNAASPNELVFIPGANSIWREIKTNGDYAYVTTEAEEGLLIIDLSPLPLKHNITYKLLHRPCWKFMEHGAFTLCN